MGRCVPSQQSGPGPALEQARVMGDSYRNTLGPRIASLALLTHSKHEIMLEYSFTQLESFL